jgi:pyruvate,water dikinase
LEKYLCSPQDIEWAIAGGRLYLLQSRPITTMQAHNPTTGEWNDSLTGDYLWTNANFGEAFPDVMTPFTWSIVERYLRANRVGRKATHYPQAGNIGGRLYMNLSLGISSVAALGLPWQRLVRVRQETFGRFPSDIPLVPYTASQVLRTIIPAVVRQLWQLRKLRSRIPSFVDETPALARRLEGDIQAARTTCDLLSLWCNELEAHLDEGLQILLAGLSEYRTLSRKLHIKFEKLVGDADANALLSGVSSGDDALASLGLLMGLLAVSRGELTREEYLQAYGDWPTSRATRSTCRPCWPARANGIRPLGSGSRLRSPPARPGPTGRNSTGWPLPPRPARRSVRRRCDCWAYTALLRCAPDT